MVDVGGSSVVARSSADQTVREFDVAKEHDILRLLQFVRRGPFDDTNKTELRDAILDFATSRNEETLKNIAERTQDAGVILANNGSVVIETEAPSKSAQSIGIGSSRPQPAFGVSQLHATDTLMNNATSDTSVSVSTEQSKETESPTPELTVSADTPANERKVPVQTVSITSPAPEEKPTAPKQETVAPVPNPVRQSQSEPKTPIAPAEIQQPAAQDAQEQSVQSQTSGAPIPPEQVAASTPRTTSATDVSALQRIKEIKRSINKKVGNPVNLIDANNTIGREYMNALLNAMRVVSGSNTEEISLAMDRLEKAFRTVNESIDSGETVIGEKKESPVSNERQEEQTQPTQTPPTPAPPVPASSATREHAQTLEEASSVTRSHAVPELAADVSSPPASLKTSPAPVQSTTNSPQAQMRNIVEDARLPEVEQKTSAPATPQRSGQPKSIAEKLAEENAQRESLLKKRANELQLEKQSKEHHGDPLYANEISAGLQQLLSEWKLFKGSGIFGTGPSGYEHLLYKQLSAMPMAAVIAGRFEGATPEIKQSIADYMNGWRYEQGVVHEMNETFEHYLRRVVKEILEKQKGPEA